MEITINLLESFHLYKRKIFWSILYGLLKSLLMLVAIIPIIGAYIFADFYPRLLVKYYKEVSGEEINPDYNTAFSVIFFLITIYWVFMIISIAIPGYFFLVGQVSISMNNVNYANINYLELANLIVATSNLMQAISVSFTISFIVFILLCIFSLYSFYGSLFGKVKKYKFSVDKSVRIFVNLFTMFIILLPLYLLLSIFALSYEWFSMIQLLYLIFIIIPLIDLTGMVSIKRL
ncbi:MAG: hypothetical protein ACPLX8_00730 [Nanopusillaceae archaeon]